MRRQDKYPNTTTFNFYNANPHNRITGDCTTRAICTALHQSWEDTVMDLVNIGLPKGLLPNERACYERYLASKGFIKHKQPRKADNTKYTGKEFCELLNTLDPFGQIGDIIAHIGGHHIVCIRPFDKGNRLTCKHKVMDHWNSTNGCIGNWWSLNTKFNLEFDRKWQLD